MKRYKSLLTWAFFGFLVGAAVLVAVDGFSLLTVVEATLVPPVVYWCLSGIGGAVLTVTVVITVERGVFYYRLEYG